ncbi:unnamed protein product [Ilex paraguariensis]|uniref:Pectinesterase n=1 Tax=Ilex paraguariensis TaxID=185542 RepID=A0ABC8RUP2_9AQUA
MWSVLQGKSDPEFNTNVALDGSGDFNNISNAVNVAPNYSKQKYYIKIKAGTYNEHVFIGREKTNIAFIGEDIRGDGFIAKHITFRNSAGQTNGQAVAMKCSSSFSALYRCRFDAYQDTLYVQTGIQFYRECEVFGTIDIIFGDATVVFQNCGVYVYNPGKGHSNVITAQGRSSTKYVSGISLHNCTIKAANDLNPGVRTYLGRPWRPFSTVVIMQSCLGDIVDPEGWHRWDNNTSTLATLYYGEYQNNGPGSNISKRVR